MTSIPGFFAALFWLPPADERFLDRDALKAIGARYNQEFVGPSLPPKVTPRGEDVVGIEV
jgi:hypothetical protein